MQVSRNPEFAFSPPPLSSTSSGRREFVKKTLIRTISRGTKCFHKTKKKERTTVCVYTEKEKAVKSFII